MKTQNRFGEDENAAPAFWNMLGPVCVLAAYALSPKDPLILSIGVLGIFLSARWHMRGLFYAALLLVGVAAAEHLWLTQHHLWQLGLEGSLAVAFFVTALSGEQGLFREQSLLSRMHAQADCIANLEEEQGKLQQEIASQRIEWEERIASSMKEAEESRAECSSLTILADVLRKTSARDRLENQALQENLLQAQQRAALALGELSIQEREVARLKNEEALVIENRDLIGALNAARFDKEQTRLISETVARLHAKESLRAKELEEAKSHLEAELSQIRNEMAQLQHERNELSQTCEKIQSSQPSATREESTEEIAHLQKRVKELLSFEALYKQLRAQFDEKNAILHQTRTELFHADTELQTLKIEREHKELEFNPISEEIRSELAACEEELSRLEQENQHLLDLVSHLTKTEAPFQKKK